MFTYTKPCSIHSHLLVSDCSAIAKEACERSLRLLCYQKDTWKPNFSYYTIADSPDPSRVRSKLVFQCPAAVLPSCSFKRHTSTPFASWRHCCFQLALSESEAPSGLLTENQLCKKKKFRWCNLAVPYV